MHTKAKIIYDGEPMLVRAIMTARKGCDPQVLGDIESWDGDRWVEIEDDANLVYEAECALIDAYDPRAEEAYGDWRIP